MKSLIYLLLIFFAVSNATSTDQPRLQTVDGHLFIYGGSDKNLTFMTTGRGCINVNGENLHNVVQDAKKATSLLKNMKYTTLTKLEDDMKSVISTMDQYSQRLNLFESSSTTKPRDRSYYPMITNLNSRVAKLERRVRTISRNLRRNECRRDPCLNGGTCLDRYLGYECRCPEGWEGKKCEKDVNECAKFAGTDLGCQNGATCINKRGSYECHCAPGWYGLHCLRRSSDCSNASEAELCGQGVCVNQASSVKGYVCICNQGWKTDSASGACTVDVDECSTFPCSRNPLVSCHNAPGSFFCGPCPQGYSGNGFQCTDVNECLIDNGGCSVEPMVSCINTVGSSTCGSCPPGYSGDGRTCIFIGKCQIDNGGCHSNAKCIEIGTNIQCQCLPGYTGYGIGPLGCVALSGPVSVDPCQPNPCKNGGRCYASSESNFSCACLPGFMGITCNVRSSCDSNPCQNGGTCEIRGNSFRCQCPSQYRGSFCENRVEECGEYMRADEGTLKYPLDNATIGHDSSCAWVIRVNSTQIINIIFDYFELRSSFECQLEWMEIHDGRSTGDVTLGRFCGKTLPNNGSIFTSQNLVYIWFNTMGGANTKFQLRWNATEPMCGGSVNASVHGIITSPGYPGKYPNNRDCYWEITVPVGKRIMFTIFELRLNSGAACLDDYVEVHESLTIDSPLLAKFCNTTSPELIETPGNTALVYFHSNGKGTDKGFQIAYHPKPGHPGCGGIFTSLRGEISPPVRNELYLPNMDCAWIIRLPEERRVNIEFTEFSLQTSRSCRFDFVEVRDGGDVTAPLIGKYCGADIPPSISSNHRTMFIRFYSDEYLEGSGFRIRYKSICNEIHTADSGVITSPGYPNSYKNEEECVIIIQQPPGKIINLEFQDFELESTYRCFFDYLEIRDGNNEHSPLIGRYCGSQRPGKIVSSYNYLHLKLVSDHNVQLMGFYANYSTVDVSCGGIHSGPSGVINSPTEAADIADIHSSTLCRWVIAALPGQLIQLTFDRFQVRDFSGCLHDYVEVYDNNTALKGNNLIGRYCTGNKPPVLTSSDNLLTIVFKYTFSFASDIIGEGFSASYVTINGSTTCGGKYFTEWGIIRSPNYPSTYPNGIKCVWHIHVNTGHKISLNVSDFALEKAFGYRGKECKFDYLEIRDGGHSSSPLIGRYCGTEIPKQILSQSNNLYLEFSSDTLDSRRGFEISWDGSIKGCGGNLIGYMGSIMSPNYPGNSGWLVNCIYRISVANGNKIQLNFVDMDLLTTQDCNDEHLEIIDGTDGGKSLGKYCSQFNMPHHILSTSNHLTVIFKSIVTSSGKGFYLKYFTVCRANITGYRGVIESPNYPNDYPTSLDCTWTIKAPLGNKVSIAFTDYNLKSSCRNSYLEITEGLPDLPSTNYIGKYCKNNKTQGLDSSMQWLTLRFVTSLRSIGGNFRLEWAVKGCGGHFTKSHGSFTSPNYPNLYPPNTHCEWWITVSPVESITLVISDLSMEKMSSCDLDSLEIYGGPDGSSPLLTKLCNVRKDSVTVTSSGNNMYIIFKSDISNVGRGFKAYYSTSPTACGGLFTAHTGTIHSRNYPKNYQLDYCEWLIQVDTHHKINLTFTSFDIYGGDENCTSGVVEVHDGSSVSSPSIWRHCGNNLQGNRTVISTSNTLTVVMKVTNDVYTAKGFLANYALICGGVINADDPGTIDSISYVNLEHENCSWLIFTEKPDGHVILTLSQMATSVADGYDGMCADSRLQIYDGRDENSTLIGSYCTSSPLPIISHGNSLYVVYVLYYGVQQYFRASYSSASSACGGELASQSGTFASPNYPDSYPPMSECIWTIKSAPGNRLQLNFKIFDITSSENCNDEYVEIRDTDGIGKLIGVYCGSDSPGNITAHNALWIKFKSSKGGSGTMRFLADYSLVYGNELNGTSGQIASPGYPVLFSSFLPSITWRITVNLKKFIFIEIIELFIDSTALSDCSSSLVLYDGFDETAPVLAIFCDAQKPEKPLVSSSNVVYISFASEPYNIGSMFLLNWKETNSKAAILPATPTSSPVPGCGGEYSLSSNGNASVVINVPGEEGMSSIKCIWKIKSPEQEHLSMSFISFDLKSFSFCESSYISVETDKDGSRENLGKFCHKTQTNKTVHGSNELLITYNHPWPPSQSPASILVRIECGGSIRGTRGIINFDWKNYWATQSQIHDNPRIVGAACQWDIMVTPGRTIRTTFQSFSFNGVGNTDNGVCQDNYVTLRNGGSEESPFLGKGTYCAITDVIPKTTSNRLFVKAAANFRLYGFTLSYKEIPHDCGGRVTLDEAFSSTVISSPLYPNVPPMKVECIWTFVTVGARSLQMDFIDRFDVAYSYGCSVEYVQVRDGGTDLSQEIGRFCGEKPSTLKTTGNMMYVRYFTNTTDPSNGFRATVSLSRCGGLITGSSGVIISPGYPNSYPYHTECLWEIETNSISTLRIKFDDVDLPANDTVLAQMLMILRPNFGLSVSDPNKPFTYKTATKTYNGSCSSSAYIIVGEPLSKPRMSNLGTNDNNENAFFAGPFMPIALQNTTKSASKISPLALICSSDANDTIQTSMNKAVIKFVSGASDPVNYFQTPRGFKISFTSVRGGCLHRLYTESGIIETPKNPVGQLGYYNCEWRITVPRGRRISVTVVEYSSLWTPKGFKLIAYNDHGYRSPIGSIIPKSGPAVNNVVKSTSNLMTISFVSPFVLGRGKFKLVYNSDEPAVCGGNITDTEGSIRSPENFTSFYCPWYFVQRPKANHTLSLVIYDSIIGNRTGTCSSKIGSFLWLRSEGVSLSHNAVVCGNISSKIIRTPFTHAVLKGFKSQNYFGDVDFKIKYKISPCGGVLHSSEFTILSPNYPDSYPNDMDCAWLVDLPFDPFVKITIEDLKLDTKSGCSDYLLLRNGPSLDSPIIEKYCGTPGNSFKPIVSIAYSSSVLIEFHSDSDNAERGFKINIESLNASCGGVVHTQDAEITTPNFPSAYGNNQECEWEIRTVEGMHIGLVFMDRFHIEESTDCKKDYIKVFDYVQDTWKLIKTICGREFPPSINSTANRMKVLFHSDDSVTADGFKAKWFSNCGATFSSMASGRIVSPGYPGKYPSDVRCEYFIEYPRMLIDFNFTYFNIEKGSQGSCIYDSIEFFSMTYDKTYVSEGKYCGSLLHKPKSIKSKAKIVFVTDTFANFNGFVLNFEIDQCGRVITNPTEISYQYGHSNHFEQGECQWNITAPENKIVVLRFVELRLPFTNGCEGTMKITEKNGTGSPVTLAKLCGYVQKNLPTIRSTSNEVTLNTATFYGSSENSFRVIVSFSYGSDQGCGGYISLDSNPETIISPDIDRDGNYEELMDCNWLILAKPFHYITANFLRFDVDNCHSGKSNNVTGKCLCDFVELRNGIDHGADVLSTACGSALPSTVTSSGSAMSLRLFTDSKYNGKGFSIQFSSVLSECGNGYLNATDRVQVLSFPNPQMKSDEYPMGIRCKWIVSDRKFKSYDLQETIHIHVVEWDLEESFDCSVDSLSLSNTGGVARNVFDDEQRKILNHSVIIVGKSTYYDSSVHLVPFIVNDRVLCGKGKSFDYYSTSNEVTIDFVSKGKIPRKGFKLEYSFAGCSRNYSADHGQIIVSGLKKTCEIIITAPSSNHTISLYFYSFNINSGCSEKYLEVRDGKSADSPLIGKYCSFERPKPVFSSGQYLRLRTSDKLVTSQLGYYGNPFYNRDAFDLIFTTSDQGKGCGGRLSSMAGVIYSPEYPKNIRRRSLCRWDISVPKGMEIAIKFNNFDIGPSNICETDHLAIYDVASDGVETLRSKFCGGTNPAEIRSPASAVAIKYSTSVHNGGIGWELEYKIVVPGTKYVW